MNVSTITVQGKITTKDIVINGTCTGTGCGAGDNLGNHIATKMVTAGYGVDASTISVSTITASGNIVAKGISSNGQPGSGYGLGVSGTYGGGTTAIYFYPQFPRNTTIPMVEFGGDSTYGVEGAGYMNGYWLDPRLTATANPQVINGFRVMPVITSTHTSLTRNAMTVEPTFTNQGVSGSLNRSLYIAPVDTMTVANINVGLDVTMRGSNANPNASYTAARFNSGAVSVLSPEGLNATYGVVAGSITTSSATFQNVTINGACTGAGCGGSGGVTVYPATATASFPYGINSATVTLTDSIFFNGVKTIAMDSSNNNFIGYAAGGLMQSGVNNVFLGDFAGFYHQSGDQNLYIGNQSGSDGVHRGTGHDNIYIGANTWSKNNSDSYCTAIGFGATCPHSNAVKLGGEDANSQMVYMSSMTVSSATVTGLRIGGLVNQACIGTSANGTVQAGTCGGGGSGSPWAATIGVSRSSPTSDLMMNPAQFVGTVVGSTMSVSLLSSSVTLQGNTDIPHLANTQTWTGQNTFTATTTVAGVTFSTMVVSEPPYVNRSTGVMIASSLNLQPGTGQNLCPLNIWDRTGQLSSVSSVLGEWDFNRAMRINSTANSATPEVGDKNGIKFTNYSTTPGNFVSIHLANAVGGDSAGIYMVNVTTAGVFGGPVQRQGRLLFYTGTAADGFMSERLRLDEYGRLMSPSFIATSTSMTVTGAGGLTVASLGAQTCVGSDANGKFQAGTCGGSGGGYAVEPATITFNLAKGFTASTGTITGADGLTVTYGVTAGSFTTTGTGAGSLTMTEGSAPSGVASKSVIWADATAHWPKFIPNNGQAYRFVGSSATASAGNCAKFTADGSIVDAGAACGTGVSSGGGFAMQPTTATINISSGVLVSGSAGNAGEFLRSGGAGTVPTWASPAGSGDVVKASTQAFTGGNEFYGGTTFYGEVAMVNKSTVTYDTVLVEVSTLSLVRQIRWADGTVQVSSPPAGGSSNNDGSFGMTFDGGGTALSASATSYVEIPFSGTITGWTIYSDVSGSANISVYKDTYANFPPTVADIINGTETPLLSTAQKNQDLTLSSWTTAVTKGDIVAFVLNSASTLTRVTVTVRVTKS